MSDLRPVQLALGSCVRGYCIRPKQKSLTPIIGKRLNIGSGQSSVPLVCMSKNRRVLVGLDGDMPATVEKIGTRVSQDLSYVTPLLILVWILLSLASL